MKDLIEVIIRETLQKEEKNYSETYWKAPIIGYAQAEDPLFRNLKGWVSENHLFPHDILPEAVSVIVFFLPFTEAIVTSNIPGRNASYEWGEAYIKTNQMIATINESIAEVFMQHRYQCKATPATHNFNEKELISNWSHRHLGYIAGLGTFGHNNMLITEQGCCGRLGSCVTNYPFEPTPRPVYEYCLYKFNGTCQLCVTHCVNHALMEGAYNRFRCYEMCLENDAYLEKLGLTDVCGKCLVGLPCSMRNPAAKVSYYKRIH
jgi:epoxyqueuosine reductase QueG